MGKRPDAALRLQGNQFWKNRKSWRNGKNSAYLAAKQHGDMYYTTGKLCPFGHRAQRTVSNRACTECSRERDLFNSTQQHIVVRRMLNAARGRATRDSLPFTITVENIAKIWPADNLCPITRIELKRTPGRGASEGKWPSPSLDKIVPELGYVPGNIAVISYRANILKRDCSDPTMFRRIADYIDKHTSLIASV